MIFSKTKDQKPWRRIPAHAPTQPDHLGSLPSLTLHDTELGYTKQSFHVGKWTWPMGKPLPSLLFRLLQVPTSMEILGSQAPPETGETPESPTHSQALWESPDTKGSRECQVRRHR